MAFEGVAAAPAGRVLTCVMGKGVKREGRVATRAGSAPGTACALRIGLEATSVGASDEDVSGGFVLGAGRTVCALRFALEVRNP